MVGILPALAARPVPDRLAEGDAYEIAALRVEGADEITTAELLSQMSTRETPGGFAKFLHKNISESLGRIDEYFDPVTFSADVARLKTYYVNRGFSEVELDTTIALSPEDRTVEITLSIREGYRSRIDTLLRTGIVGVPETIWDDIASSPPVEEGDPFNLMLLEAEVRRILRFFYDYGYPNARYVKDSSYARRFASTRNYSVRLHFDPGKRYHFGTITIEQEVDTTRGILERTDITDELVKDYINYEPGDVYSLAEKRRSEDNLNRLGIFELRSYDLAVPSRSDTAITVPSSILFRPLDKHEVAPDLFVSDEDGAFNLGTGLQYTNRNFLGGARRFATRLRFRTQTIGKFPVYFDKTSDAVANLELTFELLQPYLFTNRYKLTWAFSFVVDKQRPYIQNIVRNKIGASGRLAEYTTGFLDWSLESTTLTLNPDYPLDPTDPSYINAARLLEEGQLNSILSATLQRDRTNDLFSPTTGFVHSVTLEESGLFPFVVRSFWPDVTFTQFYRVILSGRWYEDVSLTRYAVVAWKLKAGVEEKYGESRSDSTRIIPQTHRFYAGGSTSVRGWGSRSLIARGDPQLGGNMLTEASVEMRLNIFQDARDGILDKVWLVQFLDIGNLWRQPSDFQVRDVAIATGLGFRYDTFLGPFRIDWGIRVYDPGAPPGQQWITQRKLLSETLANGVFHFGIGHAY